MKSRRISRIIASFAMAGVMAFTGAGAYAAETDESISASYEESMDFDDYVDNIKSIYKELYPDQADVVDEIVDRLSGSDDFIDYFEEKGSAAFLFIELSLQDELEPYVKPIMETDDTYTTKYLIPRITQINIQDNPDCAAAALVMSLYGCGAYTYSANENTDARQNLYRARMKLSPEKTASICEITRVLRQNVSERNGYAFQTMCFSSSNDRAIDYIGDSLYRDTAPVIKVEDTSKLSYYKGKKSSVYMVVTGVDYNAQEIMFIDPNPGYSGAHSISYDDFKKLDSKTFWVSVYAPDSSTQGINYMKIKFPQDTYYSKNKLGCTCHGWCEPDVEYDKTTGEECNCGRYNGGMQCAGFAREAFFNVKGRLYTDSIENATGFGAHSGSYADLNDTSFSGEKMDLSLAKRYLQGLSSGTYIRVRTSEGTMHSVAVEKTTSDKIYICQANYPRGCIVKYDEYTWEEFVNLFSTLFFYVE